MAEGRRGGCSRGAVHGVRGRFDEWKLWCDALNAVIKDYNTLMRPGLSHPPECQDLDDKRLD